MNLQGHHLSPVSWLVAALLLLSCGSAGGGAQRTVVVTVTPGLAPSVVTVVVTSAPSPIGQATQPLSALPAGTTQAALTPWSGETLAPPPALSPEPTATATAPVPQKITAANAGQVLLLDRLGTGAAQGLAWLPDGQTWAVAYQSGLGLYDAGTLQETTFFPAYGFKAGLAASPDGRRVATISDDGVQLWETSSGQMLHTLEAPAGGTRLIAFGAGGQTLAVSGMELEGDPASESVAVWDLALTGGSPGARVLYRLDGFGKGLSGLAFSPGGQVLVTARWYDSSRATGAAYLELWDAMTGEPLPLAGDLGAAPDGLQHLVFTPDGRLLAGAEGFDIHIWDAATGKHLQTVVCDSLVYSLALSADGRWLAAGSPDRVAHVWDVAAGTLQTTLSGHADWVTGVAFAPSGPNGMVLLATMTRSDGLQLWDAQSGLRIAACSPVGHTDSVEAVVYSPDGALLATASPDQTVWFWDAGTGGPLGMLDAHGLSTSEWCSCIWSLAVSPDGRTVATGSTDARVRLWDVDSGRLLETSQALSDLIFGLGFSPDGRRLAAGDADGLLRVWDLAVPLEAGPLLSLEYPVRLWHAGSGELLRTLEGHTKDVTGLAFTADGRILATGDWGGTIRLWDVVTGEQLRVLQQASSVKSVAFRPDGQRLAAAGFDGLIWIWGAP